jgi:Tol biopolymer transport system component
MGLAGVHRGVKPYRPAVSLVLAVGLIACADGGQPSRPSTGSPTPTAAPVPPTASARPAPLPSRVVHTSGGPSAVGDPITLRDLSGRIVFDDFEDVRAMDVDGSNVVKIADDPAGSEFDGAWSPDGDWVVYRDSTRGINDDDEIFIARANGSDRRNLSKDPANDWGPDWSPDGQTIAFNSDRDGGQLRGYLIDPDGSNLRLIDVDGWVEYPSFSPDGTRITYMGHDRGDYDIYVADLETGATEQLTDAPGNDGWPVWSPDGSTIAFTSERDDCAFAPVGEACWRADGPDDEHRDVWLIDADGSNPRRVSPEIGQFVAWSPDGRHLLISGYALYVVRPDGTGRLELRADGIGRPLGGIPDWR